MSQSTVSEGGRVVIPAELRAKLGIAVGDVMDWQLDGDRLVLQSRRAGIRRAQALMTRYKNHGQSVVDELIAERRREAARE
ncbi:MAG: AbrB/MazE/SpoVT family DNA-binding domain-containing protein [Rubrivivax sp.]|jgi:AbrB family looped-hinge helix DNA binding protein